MPVKEVRDPVRNDSPFQSGGGISWERLPVTDEHGVVVVAHHAHVNRRVRAAEIFHGLSRCAEAIVHHLEEESLLGIHGVDLARLDVEEPGIELCHITPARVLEPVRLGSVRGSMVCADRVVEWIDVEAGGFATQVLRVMDDGPELGRGVGSSRETRTRANDGNWLRHDDDAVFVWQCCGFRANRS
jgi:hypothetical protein